MTDYRFPYRAHAATIVIAFLVGLPMIGIGIYGVVTGERLARRFTALSPLVSLTIFVLILVAGFFLVVWGIRLALAGKREVIVTPTIVEAPTSPASRKLIRIQIGALSNMTIVGDPINGQSLALVTTDGETLKLACNAFGEPGGVQACWEAI